MTVITRIEEYRAHDAVEALRDLLARAEAGRLRGFAFLFKSGPHRHRYGFVGDYASNPLEALGCVSRMGWRVNEMISGYDPEAQDTRTLPL